MWHKGELQYLIMCFASFLLPTLCINCSSASTCYYTELSNSEKSKSLCGSASFWIGELCSELLQQPCNQQWLVANQKGTLCCVLA